MGKKVTVEAIRENFYAGKRYLKGQTFQTSEMDAKVLHAVRRIKYATREVTAEEVPPAVPIEDFAATVTESTRPRRRYRRRDMAADATNENGIAEPTPEVQGASGDDE